MNASTAGENRRSRQAASTSEAEMPKRCAIGTIDLAFRDIGVFGEERARNVVIEGAGCVVALLGAHELGRLECETRVHVTFRRVDWKPDLSSQTLEPRANLRPGLRRKRLRCPFGRRLRMNLEGKPT